MPAAVDTTFDVVNWFQDRALSDGEYLQPQKLHRMLFLSQAYYAAAFEGRRLMPSVFVADAAGPLEPNMYKAFENGRPHLGGMGVSRPVSQFLDTIWRRFGHHSTEYLNKMLVEHGSYLESFTRGPRAEITLECMVKHFTKNKQEVERVMGPKLARSHTGRAVEIKKWNLKPPPSSSSSGQGD